MNILRKLTASIALVALVSGIFTTGAIAASAGQLTAAKNLADAGYINEQSTDAGFNLDQNVSRWEIAKVAANIAGVSAATSCSNEFADVTSTTPNNWVCGYAEALLAEELVSANTNFNPESNISKSEAVKLMLSAAGFDVTYTDDWQPEAVAFAVDKGISTTFSDYNASATRGFVFEIADEANSEEANSEEEDEDEIFSFIDDIDILEDDSIWWWFYWW